MSDPLSAEDLGVPVNPAFRHVHAGIHLGYFEDPILWDDLIKYLGADKSLKTQDKSGLTQFEIYQSANRKRPTLSGATVLKNIGPGEINGNLDERSLHATECDNTSSYDVRGVRGIGPQNRPDFSGTRRGNGGGAADDGVGGPGVRGNGRELPTRNQEATGTGVDQQKQTGVQGRSDGSGGSSALPGTGSDRFPTRK